MIEMLEAIIEIFHGRLVKRASGTAALGMQTSDSRRLHHVQRILTIIRINRSTAGNRQVQHDTVDRQTMLIKQAQSFSIAIVNVALLRNPGKTISHCQLLILYKRSVSRSCSLRR